MDAGGAVGGGDGVVGAVVGRAVVVTPPPPPQSTFAGQSQQLQDGLKRSPGLQFMIVGTPLLHWMKVEQVASLGFGTTPDDPPGQRFPVGGRGVGPGVGAGVGAEVGAGVGTGVGAGVGVGVVGGAGDEGEPEHVTRYA